MNAKPTAAAAGRIDVTPEHVEGNIRAASLDLEPDEINAITNAL